MLRINFIASTILRAALVAGWLAAQPAFAQDQLPSQLANDPVAKALGWGRYTADLDKLLEAVITRGVMA